MPISRSEAQRLCTQAEFAVVDAGFRDRLEKLDLEATRKKARRASHLVEKWDRLAARQHPHEGEARRSTAAAKRGEQDPAVTARKRRLFKETLERYERRIERLEAARDRESRRGERLRLREQTGQTGAAWFRRREEDRAKQFKDESLSSIWPRKAMQLDKGYQRAVSGHIRALYDRVQGKRDARQFR